MFTKRSVDTCEARLEFTCIVKFEPTSREAGDTEIMMVCGSHHKLMHEMGFRSRLQHSADEQR